MFSPWHQDERARRSGLDDGLMDGIGTGFPNLGFGEDDSSFFRRPRPDSFFSLDGPVGPGKRNDPRDVIKVQTLLGNQDLGSFGRYQGPLGILLGAFKAPTPDEVDEHHAGIRGLGEEKLVWRQPHLKIGGDGKNLPEVPGEDNVHIAKAVDTLGRYSDPGDHPRWTARDIGAEGPLALARTRDMLRQLGEKSPDLADAYLRKLFTFSLPEGTREALTGQSEPERIPVGVFKEEWEKRSKPDIAFEPLDKADQGGCAVPMVYRPGEVYDCKLGGWRRETPEDQARKGPRWMLEGTDTGAGTDGSGGDSPPDREPEPADDPEAREREARVERLLRRRAERSGEDPAEAIRRYWEEQRAPASEPPVTEPPVTDTGGVTYGRKPDGSPYVSMPMPLPPLEEGGNVGKVPEPKQPFMPKPGETFSPIDKPEIRDDREGKGYFGAKREAGRKHKGIDLLAKPGERIRSPINGKIEAIAPAYKDPKAFGGEYQAIWVRAENGELYKIRYVSPKTQEGHDLVKPGDPIAAGQVLGVAQDRAKSGKGFMKNHIHVERYGRSGELLDPTPEFRKWKSR